MSGILTLGSLSEKFLLRLAIQTYDLRDKQLTKAIGWMADMPCDAPQGKLDYLPS
jgi:hypothetical protein